MNDVIKVFVACAPNFEDAESLAVLEWSIRKHASMPVDIVWMHHTHDVDSPFYGWDTTGWATPFSNFRWAVPELCGFEGRAIYCDSDVLFLADARELWEHPMAPGKVAVGKGGNEWRMCVSLFDCARAKQYLPSIEFMKQNPATHGKMNQLFRHKGLVQPFANGDWNNLDGRKGENLSKIKVLHYTRMNTQPQLKHALPRLEAAGKSHWFDGITGPHARPDVQELFDNLLQEAAENGYTIDKYMQHEPFGHVKKRSFKGRAVV